jgi:hypothetical protein
MIATVEMTSVKLFNPSALSAADPKAFPMKSFAKERVTYATMLSRAPCSANFKSLYLSFIVSYSISFEFIRVFFCIF